MPTTVEAELVYRSRAGIGEGPCWEPETGRLLWTDIPSGSFFSLDPATGDNREHVVGEPVGTPMPRSSGGYVLATRSGFRTFDPATAAVGEVWAGVPEGLRMNDGKCDPAGRFLAGTMATGGQGDVGVLYRLDPDGSVHPLVDSLGISNGMAWTADGATLYFVDSNTFGVDAFDYDVDGGSVSNRRRLFAAGEEGRLYPDGMTIDTDGCLWLAVWGAGRIQRYTPDGRLDLEVLVPASASSSCAFGGPGLDTLYITSAAGQNGEYHHEELAGSVFAAQTGHQGLPAVPFAG